MKITVNAALQRQFHSPFIFREEDPSRQVSPWDPCRPGLEPGQLGKGLPPFPTVFLHPLLFVPSRKTWTDLPVVSVASGEEKKQGK